MDSKTKSNTLARTGSIILFIVFAFYMAFLLKLLIFSRVSITDLFSGIKGAERSINIIPFRSIMEYVFSGDRTIKRFAFSNVIGNIIAFVPLGAYLPLFRHDNRISRNIIIVLAISLLVETIQGIFGIGAVDIDDLLLNCLGGLVGICGYRLFLLIFRDQKRVRLLMAILSLLGLPVILYYLFVIKLKL